MLELDLGALTVLLSNCKESTGRMGGGQRSERSEATNKQKIFAVLWHIFLLAHIWRERERGERERLRERVGNWAGEWVAKLGVKYIKQEVE